MTVVLSSAGALDGISPHSLLPLTARGVGCTRCPAECHYSPCQLRPGRHFDFRQNGSACHNSPPVTERTHHGFRWQLADDFAPLLERVLSSSAVVIKESNAKLVARHDIDGRSFFVKRYRHDAFALRPLKFFFKPSQAMQEWRLAQEFERRGLPVARHVALGERWSARGLLESVLITEGFDGVPLEPHHAQHFPRVLALVDRIAAAGVTHHDFHPSNLLLNPATGELRLIDLHGAEVSARPAAELRATMLEKLAALLPVRVELEVQQRAERWRREAFAQRSARCLKNNRDFGSRRFGRWNWHVRRAALNLAVEAALNDPDGFLRAARALKKGRSATVGARDGLVLKRYNFKKPLNALKDLFRGSKAERSFQKAYHLDLCGIPTARVEACLTVRTLGFPTRSYLLMQEVNGAVDAGRWQGDAQVLAALLARLHAEGFTHRDLKETNILFDGSGQPWLIDLDGLDYIGEVGPEQAAPNLRRLAIGLGQAGRLTTRNVVRFLLFYCRRTGFRPRELFPARLPRQRA
jgi:tRNA A-37 threonylcarbamoyl transferase component Bud32